MKLKNAIETLPGQSESVSLHPMFTPWGESLDTDHLWEEYPRPQLRRNNYRMLNGYWDYRITSQEDIHPGTPFAPDGQILVPFSPEALLSGVGKQLQPSQKLWYQKEILFTRPQELSPDSRVQERRYPAAEHPDSITPGCQLSDNQCPDCINPGCQLSDSQCPDCINPGCQLSDSQCPDSITPGCQLSDNQCPPGKCLLHFGAVDQEALVYINGSLASSHRGGYLPFTVDVTEAAVKGPCLVQVCVTDVSDTSFHSRGKQTLKRGGMFYTAQSGIWQSVWYEWVPVNPVLSLKITPYYNDGQVMIELESFGPFEDVSIQVHAPGIFSSPENTDHPLTDETQLLPMKQERFPEEPTLPPKSGPSQPLPGNGRRILTRVRLTFPELTDENGKTLKHTSFFHPWTPDAPYLYPFTLRADGDVIESYFSMRCFTVEKTSRHPVICLNHKPLFLHGILDQGYWSDGLMTAPCDEAFVYDIQLAKSFGFNMIRKHIKIEPLRWYYHCDRLGMVVWQDMVNGGTSYHMPFVCHLPTLLPFWGRFKDNRYKLLSRQSPEGRREWINECELTVEHLINVPSIAVWVPFNEGWGQFDAASAARMIKRKDPSRLVDHASGWFDQKKGDFRSVHNYFRPLSVETEEKRAFVISEYGGYACHVEGHSSVDRIYGYQKYDSCQSLSLAYWDLIRGQLKPLIPKGLSGGVYTQLSDVEEEVNGLVTYDRRVVKIQPPPSS